MSEFEKALLVIKNYLDHISDAGCGEVKFGDGTIQINSYDYYWVDDEIVENKIIIHTNSYYIDNDEDGNEFLKKVSD